MRGRRLTASSNTSFASLAAAGCACVGAAALGCSAVVSGDVEPSDTPLVAGLRIAIAAEGWEAIDAVQVCR